MLRIMTGKTLWIFLICAGMVAAIAAQEAPIKVKVVTEQANIRKDPDIGSPIIHRAPQGSTLEVETKEGEWYRVRFVSDRGQNSLGYVHDSLVTLISRPPVSKPVEKTQPEILKAPPPKPTPPPAKPRQAQPEPEPQIPEAEPPAPTAGASWERPLLRVSLSGALSYRGIGDLNSGAQGLAGYYTADLAGRSDDTVMPLHLVYIFGTEIQAELLPGLYVGLGLDYLRGSRESGAYISGVKTSNAYFTQPQVRAVPIRLSAAYFVQPSLYVKGGLEYYFAHCQYQYRITQEDFWQEWQGKADSQGFGLMAGLGFEKEITANVSFFAEGTGHLANLKDFQGSNLYMDSEGTESEESGILYIYQAHITEQSSYPLVFIRARKPTEADVSDPRSAGVNFSGIALRLGFSYRF